MRSPLVRYRNRVWWIKGAEGVLAALFGLVSSYLAVLGLDRFFDTPGLVRLGILVVGSVGLLVLFPLKLHFWVWRHRRLDQVARLVRQVFPRFGDHLLGVVELVRSADQRRHSRPLIEAAIGQVAADMAGRDLSQAVPRPHHVAWAWRVGIPLFGLGLFFLWAPDAGRNAWERWLTPWRSVDRYTFAQLAADENLLVVPYGEPFGVEARLMESSPWKPVEAAARYREQEPVRARLEGNAYDFQMPPQTEDAAVRIRVGDARRSVVVQPRLRPALNELAAEIELPAYLQQPGRVREDVRGGFLSLVRGSQVTLRAAATRELSTATLNGQLQTVSGNTLTTESIRVEQPSEFRLDWQDTLGLRPRESQVLQFEVHEDRAPNVNFTSFKNNQVVLTSEVVSFGILASDDFGVRQVGIEWSGIADPVLNPGPSSGEKVIAAGGPSQNRLQVSGTFSAERERVRAQSLKVRAYVADYLPGRERVYSPYLRLHVMDPADHFRWLTEQMGQWASAAQEVYEKELALHQRNEDLWQLDSDARQSPETQAAIQVQADAENANAAKLETLVEIGGRLVRDATKNEEFDPAQLAAWAELLRELEGIAQEQMPSVAELLGQAAEAAFTPDEVSAGTDGSTTSETEATSNTAPTGGEPDDLKQPETYGPESEAIAGRDEKPEDPNTPGNGTTVDRSTPTEGDPGTIPANPTPGVGDQESGFNEAEKAVDAAQVKGGLGIPGVTLKGSGNPPEASEEKAPTVTADPVYLAVREQKSLLDSFARLADEMNQLLSGFQDSTFVKRLKTASRDQMELATRLNELDGFGLSSGAADSEASRGNLAERQQVASEQLMTLQDDMAAYAERRPSEKYSGVLNEMLDSAVVTEVGAASLAIQQNQIGRSTIEAEFWSDTLDRWAEELVDPGEAAGEGYGEGMYDEPNLTPEIILAVLRVIRGEVDLREETRELDQARAILESETYEERAMALSRVQADLAGDTRNILEEINELPDANHEVITAQKEKLSAAAYVMDEVVSMLAKPTTGPEAIAAIAEVIEVLLEASRVPNAPMITNASPTSTPALLLIGIGDDAGQASLDERAPDQATGKSGREFPEEFRAGLDAYLNAVENRLREK